MILAGGDALDVERRIERDPVAALLELAVLLRGSCVQLGLLWKQLLHSVLLQLVLQLMLSNVILLSRYKHDPLLSGGNQQVVHLRSHPYSLATRL
jgi:hypothetical protein